MDDSRNQRSDAVPWPHPKEPLESLQDPPDISECSRSHSTALIMRRRGSACMEREVVG